MTLRDRLRQWLGVSDRPVTVREPQVEIVMVIDGATFRGQGSAEAVQDMYEEWKEMAGLNDMAPARPAQSRRALPPGRPAFNAPRWK